MAIEVVEVSPKHWAVYHPDPSGKGGVSIHFSSQAAANHLASWLRDQSGGYKRIFQHYYPVTLKPVRWKCGCQLDEHGDPVDKCAFRLALEAARDMEDGDSYGY